MEPIHDSRKTEEAATEKTAVTGGNGTETPTGSKGSQSGAPSLWRQYIEQALPIQDAGTEEKPEDAAAQPSAAGRRERIRTARERCVRRAARLARECGRKARAAAAVCREKLGRGMETLGRGTEKIRGLVARHPISPLLYVTLIAVGIGVVAFQDSYARAYVLEVNGQKMGLVADEDEVNTILGNVEIRAASILGDDFDYDVDVALSPVYAAPDALSDTAAMEDALFEEVGAYMTAWALSVDGVEMGYAADKSDFYRMLDEIAQPFIPADAIRYEFVEDVQVYPVELPSNTRFANLESIREELSALRVEEAVYVVKKGDTFNAIAYSLGMMPNDLAALNPDVIVNTLWVDQELIIQQAVPRLSVVAITDETYEEVVPSPVEYIETASLYVGSTKVKEQGKDGLALVNAQVTYLNNVEQDREILESTTLKEATTTYTYTGTTPRPTTASKGYFIWPVRGTVTSKFGYRYIFGSTSYHGGLDIAVPTGTSVKAADGGTVVKATWDNSYGYYVLIRHDNGMETVYAHNSSLLVKAGQKVYQGQIIAKSGSTGNSTGPHCHFEVRVNGTRVNPRNYLS